MAAFAILVCIVVAVAAVQAAVSLFRIGRLELSRYSYLAFGLVLMLPTMGYPLALLPESRNPNARVHTFTLPLTLAWGLGLYIVIRFMISKPGKARVVSAA